MSGKIAEKVAKKRNYMVDFCRFIAALMIMLCHLDLIGLAQYPTYMFVDFFFILSGYFTLNHFAKMERAKSADERGRIAATYTVKKFIPFIPHLVLALLVAYAVRNKNLFLSGDFKGALLGFKDMIPELLLLPSSFIEKGYRELGPLWYLSALLVVMPIFSYICQSKYRRPVMFVGLVFVYFFYSLQKTISLFDPASAFMKCLACMFLGMLVFDISNEIKQMKLARVKRICLTVLELALILYAIWAAVRGVEPDRMQTVVYVAMLSIMLSGQSYTSEIKAPFLSWIGRLSMPLFIWHYVVGRALWFKIDDYSPRELKFLFFGLSFLIAVLSDFMITRYAKWRAGKQKRQFEK